MRTEFEKARVWALMRKRIAASIYTQPGDPMKIDCGYRPNNGAPGEPVRGGVNGVVKMFHAVSLDGDVEAAKVLAYSAPRLRDGVLRVEQARLELTAVVEPLRSVATEAEADTEADTDAATEHGRGDGTRTWLRNTVAGPIPDREAAALGQAPTRTARSFLRA